MHDMSTILKMNRLQSFSKVFYNIMIKLLKRAFFGITFFNKTSSTVETLTIDKRKEERVIVDMGGPTINDAFPNLQVRSFIDGRIFKKSSGL